MPAWKEEFRATLALGVPMAGAQLAQIAMNFTDVAMVGRLNQASLAGLAVGQPLYSLCFALGIGVVVAVNPLVSQAFGAGDRERMGEALKHGVAAAVGVSLIFWTLLPFAGLLLDTLGHPEAIAGLGALYLGAAGWGLLPALVFQAYKNGLDAVSMPRVGLVIALTGAVVNVGLNWLLIFGNWGFPAMGVVGAGWATTLVNCLNALAIAVVAHRYSELGTCPRPAFNLASLRRVLEVGLPISGSIAVEVGLFVIAALMMGRLGVTEAAAHQIAIVCASTAFMVPLGLGLAATVRVGQRVGAGELAGVAPAGWSSVLLGAGFMACTAALFTLFPHPIIGIFIDTHQPLLVEMAAQMLFLAGVFQVFDGVQVTAIGALRGLKDVKVPMLIGGFSYWAVGLTLSWWLGFFTPLRHVGVWIGLVVGLGVAAVALVLRFRALTRGLGEKEA